MHQHSVFTEIHDDESDDDGENANTTTAININADFHICNNDYGGGDEDDNYDDTKTREGKSDGNCQSSIFFIATRQKLENSLEVWKMIITKR